jgi:SAM-dependent methyltransferase
VTFSKEWEERYRASTHLSVWPWSDLVSYVHRYANPSAGFGRVLELGCGAGANIPLFKALGADYHAIEGSATIVALLHSTFPELRERIVVGDFTKELPFAGMFDLIVDRSSLISNSTAAMRSGLALAASRLRAGGLFMAIDWFSDQHEGARLGVAIDSHTRHQFPPSSHLAGLGAIHFCDQEHLVGMMQQVGLSISRLEHKTTVVHVPNEGTRLAWWNLVAVKV